MCVVCALCACVHTPCMGLAWGRQDIVHSTQRQYRFLGTFQTGDTVRILGREAMYCGSYFLWTFYDFDSDILLVSNSG